MVVMTNRVQRLSKEGSCRLSASKATILALSEEKLRRLGRHPAFTRKDVSGCTSSVSSSLEKYLRSQIYLECLHLYNKLQILISSYAHSWARRINGPTGALFFLFFFFSFTKVSLCQIALLWSHAHRVR